MKKEQIIFTKRDVETLDKLLHYLQRYNQACISEELTVLFCENGMVEVAFDNKGVMQYPEHTKARGLLTYLADNQTFVEKQDGKDTEVGVVLKEDETEQEHDEDMEIFPPIVKEKKDGGFAKCEDIEISHVQTSHVTNIKVNDVWVSLTVKTVGTPQQPMKVMLNDRTIFKQGKTEK